MTIDKILEKGDLAINASVKHVTAPRIGVLDTRFLGQSVGLLNTPPAVCLRETDTVDLALKRMQERHIGCVLVTDQKGKLRGIFSERDYMQKLVFSDLDRGQIPLGEYMTKDPITIDFTVSMAYGLSLMSMGGFRHLPVVDSENFPVGVVSVKDIVNHITNSFIDDILSFPEVSP